VVFLSKLLDKRVTLRKFGGNFDEYYDRLNGYRKRLVSFALKEADCVFFETKYLVENFSDLTDGVWFPNVRDVDKTQYYDREFNKRFVFISHVKKTKGVNIILEAVGKLSGDYQVHLYGPQKGYKPPDHLKNVFDKHYKGVLQPDEVLDTMKKYDALLLPTFHDGEGYPGAILEAYSQGLPVISTRWRSIPEIVESGKTGFLCEPRSVASLIEAIQKIDDSNYLTLSEKVSNYFENFEQEKVMQRIEKYL
jgi:glycosyltransferase involved in cell wall biosynthesis